jgi:hypothetical protein
MVALPAAMRASLSSAMAPAKTGQAAEVPPTFRVRVRVRVRVSCRRGAAHLSVRALVRHAVAVGRARQRRHVGVGAARGVVLAGAGQGHAALEVGGHGRGLVKGLGEGVGEAAAAVGPRRLLAQHRGLQELRAAHRRHVGGGGGEVLCFFVVCFRMFFLGEKATRGRGQ